MRLNKELTNIEVKLETLLGKEEIEVIAKEEGFVKRKSLLNGFSFLHLNVESIGSNGLSSLTEQCMKLSKGHDIQISKQGLDDRYHEGAVKFVRKILSEVLRLRFESNKLLNLGVLDIFNGVYVRDATSSQLPECFTELFKGNGGSASKSGVKVELSYNLTGTETNLDFRNGASSDSTSKDAEIQSGSLNLQDLGYFKISRFFKIIKENAYFISRYKHRTNIYLGAGSLKKSEKAKEAAITLKKLTKGMKVNEVRSKQVYIGMQERLPVRLVIQRVPKKVSDKRKMKLRADARKKGDTVSAERLKATEYTLLITNVDSEVLTGEQVIETYRIRWQIEIMFKCWKSVMKFGIVHPMKPHRFLCMLYGQMILIVLTMKIVAAFKNICWIKYKIELSELKCFKLFKIYQDDFMKAIISNNQQNKNLDDFIQLLFQKAFLFAEKEYKKNNPNPLYSMT